MKEAYRDFWKRWIVIDGVSTRPQFWWPWLIHVLISMAISILAQVAWSGFGIFSGIFGLVILIPSFCVAVRRLHDMGKSGWWLLLLLIPLVGWIILIIFLATPTNTSSRFRGSAKSA